MKIFTSLTIFLLVFAFISYTGCGEDEIIVANYVGVSCVNNKVHVIFDAEPTHVYVEHVRFDRIVSLEKPIFGEWEVKDNKIITTCEKYQHPDLIVIIKVQWGQPSNEEVFYCPCK